MRNNSGQNMALYTYSDTHYYSAPKQVKRLFEIAIQFIATKASQIESLENFPQLIGEEIFKQVVASGKLTESRSTYKESVRIWEKFLEAYDDMILPSLNLSHSLLVINEFTDPLCTVLKNVVEVDLSNCFLGPMHEIMLAVAHADKLKRLSFRKNGLNDISIQKLTMPVRRFKEGPMDLIQLDLSGNPRITDEALVYLSAFKKLEMLNLSGTSITVKGIEQLENMGLYMCAEEKYRGTPITTKGWAEPVVRKWKKFIEDRKKRKSRPLGVYGMCRNRRMFGAAQEKPKIEEPPEEKFYFQRKDSTPVQLISSNSTNVSKLSNMPDWGKCSPMLSDRSQLNQHIPCNC